MLKKGKFPHVCVTMKKNRCAECGRKWPANSYSPEPEKPPGPAPRSRRERRARRVGDPPPAAAGASLREKRSGVWRRLSDVQK